MPQVQADASPDQGRERLVRHDTPGQPNTLCSLDVMSWQRPNIGSRVTREGHARFWESPGGEIPPGDSTTCEDLLLLLHRRSIFNSGNVADGQHRRSVPRVKRWESGPSGPRASVASWDQERQADWAAAAASHKVELIESCVRRGGRGDERCRERCRRSRSRWRDRWWGNWHGYRRPRRHRQRARGRPAGLHPGISVL